jgi:hypothetical protein
MSTHVDQFFVDNHDKHDHSTDMEKVEKCIGFMTFYVFFIPLLLYGFFFCFGSETPDYQRLLGVYGYSYAIFVIATVFYIIPIEYVRWTVLLIAGLISLFVISKELLSSGTEYLEEGKLKLIAFI